MSNVIDIDLGTQVGAPITTGLTDDSIVFGASGGQGAAAPDDIAALGLWNYALAKMASDGVNARAALSVYSQAQIVAGYYTQGQTDALLAFKAPLASPVFTGNPTAPTQSPGNNTQRLATTAYVDVAIASLINSAPGVLDTLGEIATALQADESTAAALATTVAGKLAKASNLSDLPSVPTARGNLGLGSSAVIDIGTSGTKVPLLDGANTWSALQTASGGIAFAAGLVNAPGIFPIGDTNTGLWAPAADTLALSTGGTERVRVDSSGFVGIGTTAAVSLLHVDGGNGTLGNYASAARLTMRRAQGTQGSPTQVTSALNIGVHVFHALDDTGAYREVAAFTGASSGSISSTSSPGVVIFSTTPSGAVAVVERMRIDSAGNILVGYTTKIAIGSAGTTYPSFQNHGTGVAAATETYRWSADASGATVGMAKSRGAAAGTRGAVVANDSLGSLIAHGDDGTNFISSAAIQALVDGTVSTGVVPSRLVFQTTSAAGTITERVRIDSAGFVGIGTASPGEKLTVSLNTLASLPSPPANTVARLANADGTATRMLLDGFGTGASTNYSGRAARGTAASPSALHTDDVMVALACLGYGATGYTSGNRGSLTFLAAENWTDSAQGSYLTLSTTAIGAVAATERARIDSAGRLIIGLAAAASAKYAAGTITPLIQTHAAVGNEAISSYSADALGSNIYLTKSRHATVGSHTIVQSGDALGALNFGGSDGTNFITAAQILSSVDGTPGASNDMPGNITFWTTPDGSGTLAERMRITNAGLVGIGITPTTLLHIYSAAASSFTYDGDAGVNITGNRNSTDTSGPNLVLRKARGSTASRSAAASGDTLGTVLFSAFGGTTNRNIATIAGVVDTYTSDTDISAYMTFNTSPAGGVAVAERMRIDSAGVVAVGSSPQTFAGGEVPRLQLHGVSAATAQMGFGRWSNDSAPPRMRFAKSRNATIGSHTIVNSADSIGEIIAIGSDGTNFINAASIVFAIDGTPGTNDMPGRIVFSTTLDGAATVTERMRIDNVGNVKIGGTAARGTTESQGALCLFDAAQAPVGTLANGITLYSAAGECRVMDSAGNSTLLSPHDEVTNEWIYHSIDTQKNRFLGIEVERMLRAVNDEFGWDFVEDGDVDDVDDHSSKTWRTARRASKRHERESTLVDLRKRIEALEAKLAA